MPVQRLSGPFGTGGGALGEDRGAAPSVDGGVARLGPFRRGRAEAATASCYGASVEVESSAATPAPVRRKKLKRATPREVTVEVVLAAIRALRLASAAEVAAAITKASGGRHVVSGRAIRHFADRASIPWVGPPDDRRYFMPIDPTAHPLAAAVVRSAARRCADREGAAVAGERSVAAADPDMAMADVDAVLSSVVVAEQAAHFVEAVSGVRLEPDPAVQLLRRLSRTRTSGNALTDELRHPR